MTDVVDLRTRSRMMAGIRGRDTTPELRVRKALHAGGFRFRLHASALSGSPDLVLKRHRTCVFVHGCFWHQHPGCRNVRMPRTRAEFWAEKLGQNVLRDQRSVAELLAEGWRVVIVWECHTRDESLMALMPAAFAAFLESDSRYVQFSGPSRAPADRSPPPQSA